MSTVPSASHFDHAAPEPVIPPALAYFGSLLGPILYVAPFYLSNTLRTSNAASRDDPAIIQARVRAVSASCLAFTAITATILVYGGGLTFFELVHFIGIWPIDVTDILRTLLLVGILFVGPLYEQIVVDQGYRSWTLQFVYENLWESWTGYRNLIVAPISEEWVFRSLIISLYLAARRSNNVIVFCSPLVFGVAHLHHLVDFLRSHTPPDQVYPSTKVWLIGVIRSLVQFSYTSLFGFFAAFVYLRTGSVFACIAAHIFCNWQGVPRVWGRLGSPFAEPVSAVASDVSPDGPQGNDIPEVPGSTPHYSHGVGWTATYYVFLFIGAYAFSVALWPLTQSQHALVTW